MAGFVVDTSEATALMESLQRRTEMLVAECQAGINDAAQTALSRAKAAAPSGPHTKKVAGSIRVHVRKSNGGAQFTLQTEGKVGDLGAILEGGTSRSRPWLFLKVGMDESVPPLEDRLMDAVSRIIDGA